MKPEQLDEIERVAEAATPGPWQWINPENDRPRQSGEWWSSLRTVEEFPTISVGSLPKFIVEADEIYGENMDANAAFIAAANPTAVLSLIAEVKRLKEDAHRLDYLDARNARKNDQNGTRYGWRLTENHNRIALEDHHFPVLTVREAIDKARKENPNAN